MLQTLCLLSLGDFAGESRFLFPICCQHAILTGLLPQTVIKPWQRLLWGLPRVSSKAYQHIMY